MAKRRLSRQQIARIKHSQEQRRQRASRRAQRSAESLTGSDLGPEQAGRIVANYGPTVLVEDADNSIHRCSMRQNMDVLVCGDRIIWQASNNHEGVVVALQKRSSLLTRPDSSGRVKSVAANLEQVMIVVASKPPLNESLIDRYLVVTESIDVAAFLVLNKIDLLTEKELITLQQRLAVYERIGYPLILASTKTQQSLQALRQQLQRRSSILVGQSGVGKSSLSKALLPEREIRTQALSATTGLGTHTTTTSTLYPLPDGGDLIDSPGIRSFEPGTITVSELEHGFVEFAPYSGNCKFSNCSHTVEPKCALLSAVADGAIDARRLQSYLQIKQSLQR